ncbi:uncharacterized protein BJ171DRAFT_82715 [Polychytrium aggregatum]|uniref:uncharacterized protein n=1 Tax=Polychytrium aggregatum TaxID=110093 RepID=UPI0022FE7284|nr:uncharacterized protein BJ171DRAFT_82715 [Polychytrium aggregatum]KAI9205077.1 hypothetical protein BJ171DRAFT_82715 [Polychytrium aggregatum]
MAPKDAKSPSAKSSKAGAEVTPTHPRVKALSSTFRTLERQAEAINPSNDGPHYPKLAELSAPHVKSFDSIFESSTGDKSLMEMAIENIGKTTIFNLGSGQKLERSTPKLEIWIESVSVGKPVIEGTKADSFVVFPAECRERGTSYKGKMQGKLCWRVNGGPVQSHVRHLGNLPILVRSVKCNLNGKSPKELVRLKEDPDEFGGYFITNGIERLIRLLIVPRRNIAIALVRGSFQNRGPTYTPYGVQIRCTRNDQSSQTCTVHYCSDGAVTFRFAYRKQEYMVPVMLILRSLIDATDRDIFERITMGQTDNTFLTDRVELLLRSAKRYGVYTRKQCLDYLGSKFHVMLNSPEDSTKEDVGVAFLKTICLVHLGSNQAKFDLLIFMIQKLYSLVAGECASDNPDSPQFQEILLGGHLYMNYMKEKLDDWLTGIKTQIQIDIRRSPASVDFQDNKYMQKVIQKVNCDVGRKMEYFLATGNLVSNTGLDLQQVSGYTIVAEKLNFFRYIAHFRSVHRGSFFAELKTTTVRKLLPEAWGFLCPVHTPDGSPCGLLNHLSHTCKIMVEPSDASRVPALVASLGVSQMNAGGPRMVKAAGDTEMTDATEADDGFEDVELDPAHIRSVQQNTVICVQLDGEIIGYCTAKLARKVADTLRYWKVAGQKGVPLDLEIGLVPPSRGGQYPGLFLFSGAARMYRPVRYLATGEVDMVGPFEQVFMDIACMNEDIIPGVTTHQELSPTSMLSVIASNTPFSDFNQSPRNMYQCQMGKQSMGTPAIALPHRTDNKLYRLQTGQSPIVRPRAFNDYGMDGYPNGMNAVVAVISYTGYDMEDASIINKSSHERGYGYGTVYKSEFIDLSEKRVAGEGITHHFGLVPPEGGAKMSNKMLEMLTNFVDYDGLPHVGVKLKNGDPLYTYINDTTGRVMVEKYKSMEDAYVDEVRLIGSDMGDQELQKIHIKYRIPRPPHIGDKFSSRHGQKGVISQKWPSIDMPFTETGIQPDVIINPHAFPSRMTIGMFVESLAGKAGALHGHSQDATPFEFTENFSAADYFGEELKQAGYNYHGNEPLYSGITGREFKADIYIGVVFYQRLRHMVSDKYQVRTTGPVHNLTQQPVKGRKRAGGIRFGEMERDSLLAHGVSFLLQDRLFNCSDYSQSYVCRLCGSILSPLSSSTESETIRGQKRHVECMNCATSSGIEIVPIPYVFRYLCTELVAMNVKLKLDVA